MRVVAAVVLVVGIGTTARTAGPKPGAAVPPTQEIEILDPGVDPRGNPAPVLRPGPVPGRQQIDLPPAVLVHRFYYTGDRTFQGPMLPGGPMIVSVNHPRTLERVYVPVTLPPGAPQVTYTSHCIRYDYGGQSVCLEFGLCGHPKVKYCQATRVGEATRNAAVAVATGTKNFVQRTGIPEGIQRFNQGAKNAMGATADRIHDAGRAVLLPVVNVARRVPGAQLLTSSPEDKASREQVMLERAAGRRVDPENAFVPRGP
jgi:hypothetical protein